MLDSDDQSGACDWDSPKSITHCRLGDITDNAETDA